MPKKEKMIIIPRRVFEEAGKKGGKRCMETMSSRARISRARKAANARWAKREGE